MREITTLRQLTTEPTSVGRLCGFEKEVYGANACIKREHPDYLASRIKELGNEEQSQPRANRGEDIGETETRTNDTKSKSF